MNTPHTAGRKAEPDLSFLGLPKQTPQAAASAAKQPTDLGSTSGVRLPPTPAEMLALMEPILSRVRRVDHWIDTKHRSRPVPEARLLDHFNPARPDVSVGFCPIERGSSTTRLALLDLDSHKGEVPWPRMVETMLALIETGALMGIHLIPFRSRGGSGIHLFALWAEPQDARSVRVALGKLLAAEGLKNGTRGVAKGEVEIFPKQDSVPADGWGNMFVLPGAGKSAVLDAASGEVLGWTSVKWVESDPVSVVAPEPPRDMAAVPLGTPEFERVRSALFHLDPNGLGYDDWRDLLFSVWDGTKGRDEGLALMQSWTARRSDFDSHTEPEKIAQIWNGTKPGGITVGTLFKVARDAGWKDPAWKPTAEGFVDERDPARAERAVLDLTDVTEFVGDCHEVVTEERVEVFASLSDEVREEAIDKVREFAPVAAELLAERATQAAISKARGSTVPQVTAGKLKAQFRAEPKERVIATWAARAAHLPRTEAEVLIEEVERLTGIKPRKLAGALNEARQRAAKERARAAFADEIAGRTVIEIEKGEVGKMSEATVRAVLGVANPGELVVFGGALARVGERELPYTHLIDDRDGCGPPVPQLEPLNESALEVLIERGAVFVSATAKGHKARQYVPHKVKRHLLENPPASVPKVSGLISHPIVLAGGEIVAEDGLHERSRLFVRGATVRGLRPYTRTEAAAALKRIQEALFGECEFASAEDADIAVSGLFTAVERRVLDQAPGLAVLSSRQSAGKTTVARVIHVVLSGRDMPVTTLPRDEGEMQKRVLAMLLRSPELVCLDNVADGLTFRSETLAAVMTSGELQQRVLGESRDVEALTNTLWVITGNNLKLGADEVTRWMVCRLAPRTARPEERRFKHPDVVGRAMQVREQVLRDVIGIVAGYQVSGVEVPRATRYHAWERMVRGPLIWAGATDVAAVFAKNRAESSDEQGVVGLLLALRDLFGDGEFRASDVARSVQGQVPGGGLEMPSAEQRDAMDRLREALGQSRVKDIGSARAIGFALGAVTDKVVEVDGGEALVLRVRVNRGNALYSVATAAA